MLAQDAKTAQGFGVSASAPRHAAFPAPLVPRIPAGSIARRNCSFADVLGIRQNRPWKCRLSSLAAKRGGSGSRLKALLRSFAALLPFSRGAGQPARRLFHGGCRRRARSGPTLEAFLEGGGDSRDGSRAGWPAPSRPAPSLCLSSCQDASPESSQAPGGRP